MIETTFRVNHLCIVTFELAFYLGESDKDPKICVVFSLLRCGLEDKQSLMSANCPMNAAWFHCCVHVCVCVDVCACVCVDARQKKRRLKHSKRHSKRSRHANKCSKMALRRKDENQRVKTEKTQETKAGGGRGGEARGTIKMKQGSCCVYGFTVMKKYNIGKKILCL